MSDCTQSTLKKIIFVFCGLYIITLLQKQQSTGRFFMRVDSYFILFFIDSIQCCDVQIITDNWLSIFIYSFENMVLIIHEFSKVYVLVNIYCYYNHCQQSDWIHWFHCNACYEDKFINFMNGSRWKRVLDRKASISSKCYFLVYF